MSEGASPAPGRKGEPSPYGEPSPTTPGHTNTSTGGQQDPASLLGPRSTPTASAGMSNSKRIRRVKHQAGQPSLAARLAARPPSMAAIHASGSLPSAK